MSKIPIDTGRYKGNAREQKDCIEAAARITKRNWIDFCIDWNILAKSGKITAKSKQFEAKSDHDTAALVEALAENSRPWIHFSQAMTWLTQELEQMRDAEVSKLSLLLSKNAIKHFPPLEEQLACQHHFVWIKVCKLGCGNVNPP